MPHLDADALTTDRKGLDYLAGVLDVPAGHPLPGWHAAPETQVPQQQLLPELTMDALLGRRRRRRTRLVPEAA